MIRRAHETERGTAAIEFAFVLPALLLIVLGTLEWGRYFSVRESVVHAAREGARAGTLLEGTSQDACAASAAFLSTIGIRAGCGSEIAVQMNHSIVGGSVVIPAVQVQITVPFTTVTGFPLGIPTDISIEAVMAKPPSGP